MLTQIKNVYFETKHLQIVTFKHSFYFLITVVSWPVCNIRIVYGVHEGHNDAQKGQNGTNIKCHCSTA